MPHPPEKTSFWRTVPGTLSAVAGLLGAVAALLGILATLGLLSTSDEPESRAAAATSPDDVSLVYEFKTTTRDTTLTRMDLVSVPARSRIALRCAGQGCFEGKRERAVPEPAPRLSLTDLAPRLRTGTTLEIRMVNEEIGSKIWMFVARARSGPTLSSSCVPLGELVPEDC